VGGEGGGSDSAVTLQWETQRMSPKRMWEREVEERGTANETERKEKRRNMVRFEVKKKEKTEKKK